MKTLQKDDFINKHTRTRVRVDVRMSRELKILCSSISFYLNFYVRRTDEAAFDDFDYRLNLHEQGNSDV